MTSSSRTLTHQSRYSISSSKGRPNLILTYNPLSIRRPLVDTQHLRATTTNATSHPLYYYQESIVVLIRLKSILLRPLRLRNSNTLVDQIRPMLGGFNYSTH
ncbi:hypothetical protein P8452_17517 [Trifolium repens]|nr:hypothetical protein P8452_17517 [Trifolium repens]